MNVIYDEIRLDPTTSGIAVSGSDWTIDPRECLLGHYPTRTTFEVSLDESTRGKDMVGVMDYVAHLVAVGNGTALPPPDQIEALGREAIVVFLVATGHIRPEEPQAESVPLGFDGKGYDC